MVPELEKTGKEGDYASDLLTDATLNFINKNAGKKPFLAILA